MISSGQGCGLLEPGYFPRSGRRHLAVSDLTLALDVHGLDYVFSLQPLENHTPDSSEASPVSLSADNDKLLAPSPPGQPQDRANGPSQPSGDRCLPTTSPPDVAPGSEDGLAVPVPLRKSRPLSMDARIQVSEEKQAAHPGGGLSPAAGRSQKTSQSRPISSALETLGSEKLANGSLALPAPASPRPSKRNSDAGSLSTSESMDYGGSSLSADLSLNRETGSLSIKVRPPSAPQGCCRVCCSGLGLRALVAAFRVQAAHGDCSSSSKGLSV